MKIRIRFRKYGVMKFIGHLDVMRYFQKAMRRAHIDICYSEGISPHQIGFQVTVCGGVQSFYLKLSTGSTDNLKPELVLEALFLHMGLTYDPNAIQIHRKDVYASDGDDFVSLGAMGEVIE